MSSSPSLISQVTEVILCVLNYSVSSRLVSDPSIYTSLTPVYLTGITAERCQAIIVFKPCLFTIVALKILIIAV